MASPSRHKQPGKNMTKLEKYTLESKLETARDNRQWAINKAHFAMQADDLDALDDELFDIEQFDKEIASLLCDLSVVKFEEDQLSLW